MEKLSNYIIELTDLWVSWMENDTVARDMSKPTKERFSSVLICESLMEKRRNIMNEINDLFIGSKNE